MRDRKYTLFIILATFSQIFVSCIVEEKDEEDVQTEYDYSLPASGSITVKNEDDDKSYDRIISNAGYRLSSSSYDELPTLRLKADFKNEGSINDESFLSNNGKISTISVTVDEIKKLNLGQLTTFGDVSLNLFVYDNHYHCYEWCSQNGYFEGSVNIKELIANKYIVVEFVECNFVASKSEYNSFPIYGIFSGTIRFPLRKRDYFY